MPDAIQTTAEAAEADAIPRPHEVHTNPDTPVCDDVPEALGRHPVEQKSPAKWAYERLVVYIQNFEAQLDNEHEVAMGFTGGDAGVLRIEGMGYFDPDIVTFYGRDGMGVKTQMIQHVTQLNVMLRALPRQSPLDDDDGIEKPPNRIGFRLAADLGNSG